MTDKNKEVEVEHIDSELTEADKQRVLEKMYQEAERQRELQEELRRMMYPKPKPSGYFPSKRRGKYKARLNSH